MATNSEVQKRAIELAKNIGKGALHALYPKDFPNYMVSLELVSSRGITIDYFSWPILPDEIRETDTTITNIRKTMSAVNVQKNPTFNPRQISIKGDFGRNFKILIGGENVLFAGFGLSLKNGKFKWKSNGLRMWNEVATLALVSIVFLVEMQNSINWIKGTLGFFGVAIGLMIGIKIYKKSRQKTRQ